ncbi:MAG TPA: fibronectin type III domain-containing protein, partial [Patescibacteria group bacterium]
FLKLISIFVLTVVIFFSGVNSVSAEVFTRFVTSGTFSSQTNEGSLTLCDNSTSSTYGTAFYDYFTVDNTNLPSLDDVISVDYCVRGQGDIVVGMDTGSYMGYTGDGSEQCYNLPKANLPSPSSDNHSIWHPGDNGFSFMGGANIGSSIDCLYVKINTSSPTPTPTCTGQVCMTPTAIPTNMPTPTPTSMSMPIPTMAVSGGSGGGGTSMPSAPVCNDKKPGGVPVLLLAVSSGPNSITLNWVKANDPVSYYLVTFGTKPGEQLYGNPNVGGSNTTSYTIDHLSGGKNYYFKIRGGNGCMPGDYSNEVIGRLTGGFITGVPGGFAPGVLGAATRTSPQPLPTIAPIKISQLKGVKTKNFLKYISPIALLILMVLIILFFYKKRN